MICTIYVFVVAMMNYYSQTRSSCSRLKRIKRTVSCQLIYIAAAVASIHSLTSACSYNVLVLNIYFRNNFRYNSLKFSRFYQILFMQRQFIYPAKRFKIEVLGTLFFIECGVEKLKFDYNNMSIINNL